MVDINTEDPSDLEKQFAPRKFLARPAHSSSLTFLPRNLFIEMNMEQQSPSRSVYSEFTMSSPPTSPAFPFHTLPFENYTNEITPTSTPQTSIPSNCPFCQSQTRLCDQVACSNCITSRSLQYAQKVWADSDMHSTFLDRYGAFCPSLSHTHTVNGYCRV